MVHYSLDTILQTGTQNWSYPCKLKHYAWQCTWRKHSGSRAVLVPLSGKRGSVSPVKTVKTAKKVKKVKKVKQVTIVTIVKLQGCLAHKTVKKVKKITAVTKVKLQGHLAHEKHPPP